MTPLITTTDPEGQTRFISMAEHRSPPRMVCQIHGRIEFEMPPANMSSSQKLLSPILETVSPLQDQFSERSTQSSEEQDPFYVKHDKPSQEEDTVSEKEDHLSVKEEEISEQVEKQRKPFHHENGKRYPLSFFLAEAVRRQSGRREARQLAAKQILEFRKIRESRDQAIEYATSRGLSCDLVHATLESTEKGYDQIWANYLAELESDSMATNPTRPVLQTSGLSNVTSASSPHPDDIAAASPARGKEMRMNLMHKLRAPPFVHAWEFWHDRQERKQATTSSSSSPPAAQGVTDMTNGVTPQAYEERLTKLSAIADVREFWSVYNNFDVSKLAMRDSIHLFHRGVKPLWEDPRNARGGAWTFRVQKQNGEAFWKEICMMAVGEQLQKAVETKRDKFNDDICGVSLGVRFTSYLITIWNRDADNEAGVERLVKVVMENLPEELQPKKDSYYYKRHSEHTGFKG